MWVWYRQTPTADDIIAVPHPLVSADDFIGGSVRAVHGVWGSGANTICWVVELEGGVNHRGRCCVGVAFVFPARVCNIFYYSYVILS